jgi:hypothetical protein
VLTQLSLSFSLSLSLAGLRRKEEEELLSLGCRRREVPSLLPDFVPPWVSLVEARVSQPLGLWSFESPWTCSSDGFSPPSLFGLWSVFVF